MVQPKEPAVSVAEAKKGFSDLLGRVAYGHERILITRRGRPMARLVPVEDEVTASPLGQSDGWLNDDHPFFAAVDEIVKARSTHRPRSLAKKRRRK